LKTESFENGTMGCAMFGAVAYGDFSDISEAASGMVRYARRISPDPRRHAIYREKLALYKKLYGSLMEINRGL
jgi:sugar (pentulose or hexulose) kinase